MILTTFITLTLVSTFSAYGGTKPDTDKERVKRELNDAQIKTAQAYSNYYHAIQGTKDPARRSALKREILSPAQENMIKFMGDRRKEQISSLYGKTYNSNAEVVPTPVSEPKSKAGLKNQSNKKKAAAKPPSEPISPPVSRPVVSSPSRSSKQGGRQQWVLDGSNIPKVLEFPGKKTQQEK